MTPIDDKRRKRRELRRKLLPRGLSFTREGKVYVFVTLGVGFAAVNTGNNLLFLVLGMMLGLIIVSGILSETSLRKVTVSRRLSPRVEAGTIFPVELALKNDKSWAASFSVELRDEIDGEPYRRRCFFLRVGPREERSIAYRCELNRRGMARFDGTIVSTRFPFGLFEKSRFIKIVDDVLVLPARVPVVAPRGAMAPGDEGASRGIRGPGQDYLELREMTDGDDPRLIHWPATARLGRTVVRETERDSRGYVELVLDPAPESGDRRAIDQSEHRIRIAGTLVRDLVAQGMIVRLVTSGNTGLEASSRLESIRLLEHLALLDLGDASAAPPPRGRWAGAILIGPRARSNGTSYRVSSPAPPRERAS